MNLSCVVDVCQLSSLSLLQNQRIRGLLEKCSVDHEARLEALQNEIRERAVSDAKWKEVLQGSGQPVSLILCGLIPCVGLSMELYLQLYKLVLFCPIDIS